MPDSDLGTDYALKGAREEGKTGQEEWDRLLGDKEARRALLRKLNKQGLERGCPHGCLREKCSKQEKSSRWHQEGMPQGNPHYLGSETLFRCGTCANNTKVTSHSRKL